METVMEKTEKMLEGCNPDLSAAALRLQQVRVAITMQERERYEYRDGAGPSSYLVELFDEQDRAATDLFQVLDRNGKDYQWILQLLKEAREAAA